MSASRLATRLTLARQRRFVGREAERDLFQRALVAPDLPFAILYIYGPGGIGKTTLLGESLLASERAEVPAIGWMGATSKRPQSLPGGATPRARTIRRPPHLSRRSPSARNARFC